jgi:predicted kinase
LTPSRSVAANVPKSVPRPKENGPRRNLLGPFQLVAGQASNLEISPRLTGLCGEKFAGASRLLLVACRHVLQSLDGLLILTGPPGAGKSTVAKRLALGQPKSVHLHTDDFWHCIVAGLIPPYLSGSEAQNKVVLDVVARTSVTFAAGGYFTVTDGIVGPWMLDHFRAAAALGGSAQVHYVVLRPSLEVTLRRAQGRQGENALIDEEPVLHMWNEFAQLDAYEKYVLDTSNWTVEETISQVAAAVSSGRHRIDALQQQEAGLGT